MQDGPVDLPAGPGQLRVERLGLDARPREPVEDRAAPRVRLLEPVEEDADDRVVGHELAAGHVAVGLTPERRARGHGRAEQLAGAEDRHAEMVGDDRSLGALSGARRPEEHDDLHRPALASRVPHRRHQRMNPS